MPTVWEEYYCTVCRDTVVGVPLYLCVIPYPCPIHKLQTLQSFLSTWFNARGSRCVEVSGLQRWTDGKEALERDWCVYSPTSGRVYPNKRFAPMLTVMLDDGTTEVISFRVRPTT